mgnify:CR=1 FL=1
MGQQRWCTTGFATRGCGVGWCGVGCDSCRHAGFHARLRLDIEGSLGAPFDRDAGDILRLQTEIATSVADTLKVTLLGDVATKIELGGTRIPAAFDAYLRGRKAA